MINHKQGMFLLCAFSMLQVSCSEKVVRGGVVLLSVGGLVGLTWMQRVIANKKEAEVAYHNETARLLAHADIKAALEMLNSSSDCTIGYGFYHDDGESCDYWPFSENGEKVKPLYKSLKDAHPSFLETRAFNIRVCSGASCIEVPSLGSPGDIKSLLSRVENLQ